MLNKLLLPVLAVALAVVASAGGGAAWAQPVDNPLPPLADLSIAYDYPTSPGWLLTVRNNTVGRHPSVTAYLVKVRVVFGAVNGYQETRIWEIRDLPPGGSVTTEYRVPSSGAPHWPTRARADAPSLFPMLLHAEIIETVPVEPPGFQHNNATEGWVTALRASGGVTDTYRGQYTHGDISVRVEGISDRFPQEGGATTFTVSARNDAGTLPYSRGVSCGFRRFDCDDTLFDVQVKISLSPGLAFAENQQAPDGTTFDPATGIWEVGTLEYNPQTRTGLDLPVAVNLADSLADPPLEERCLTAKVVRAVPWFALQRDKRENDTVTECLGKILVQLTKGKKTLFDFYPCVGVTAYPCSSADTLELVATDGEILQPDELIVHISDPEGRKRSSAGKPLWTTSGIFDLKDSQARLSGPPWSAVQEDLTVTGPDGGQLPGSFTMNFVSSSIPDIEIVNATKFVGEAFDPGYDAEFALEFGALGQYVLTMDIKATHSIAGQLTDTGTYTFHVGPVAELEVRDAGPNPAMDTNQHAYTITAVNNGPDPAPVEVTLTPWRLPSPDIANGIPSEGSYRDGVWYIEKLESRKIRRASGQSEGPTLTVIADSDVPLWADVAAGDYSVCIGNDGLDIGATGQSDCTSKNGSWHTGNYYDLHTGNNRADIMPWPGTGAGHPEAPASLTALDTVVGNILQWEPVGMLNGRKVTHYHVQSLGQDWRTVADDVTGTAYLDEDFATGMPQYRARAVNLMGVEGPWSIPTLEQEGEEFQSADPQQRPDPATGLVADAGDGYVDLTWNNNQSSGRDIFWQLWRSDDQTWREIAPRGAGSSRLGYTVTGLENGTEYIFRVRAATTSEHGDLVPGVSSGPVLATPTAPLQPPPSGPNNPPEFDRATAWPDPHYCVNAGAGPGTQVGRVTAYDPDGDRLYFFRRGGFDEIADNHFTVRTATVGGAYWGVIEVSRRIPGNLDPPDGFIVIDLEVSDGRGGIDQIGVTLQYDPDGGNCQDTNASSQSGASGENWSSVLATVRTWLGSVRDYWLAWGGWSLTARPT